MQRFLLEVSDLIGPLQNSEYQVSPQQTSYLQERFLQGIPLAYLQGFSDFYDHRFFITSGVLAPRPETEYLVDLIINGPQRFSSVLDVGVGSGVILLSVLASGKADFGIGADISPEALDVAATNSRRLRLERKCEFVLSDRLEKIQGKFELIVSNPPYIKRSSHHAFVQATVDIYEPHTALYLDDEIYSTWFEEFFKQIKFALMPDGVFMMEGHELELQHQGLQLQELGFSEVSVLKDLAGRDRFLRAKNSRDARDNS